MFCKSTLVAVALSLLALAKPATKPGTIHIPLAKRNSLTKLDGTFDHDEAVLQNIKTFNKYQLNLRTLIATTGSVPAGVSVADFKTIPDGLRKRAAAGVESLTDENQDTDWAGNIFIGTPARSFLIDFDTGSSDLWVPSAACTSSICSSKNKYDASESSTGKKQEGTFEIQYGDKSTVSGPIYTDTVTVAGITVTNQLFSPATSLSQSFQTNPIDGLLGLAWPSISNLKGNPFVNTAVEQGQISAGEFAFHLASSGSTLHLGGLDPTKYTGEIEYQSTDNSLGYWVATGAQALVDSETVFSGFDTIIDSGTSIMYGPPDDVNQFYSTIAGASLWDSDNRYYSFPCDSVPNVGFNWGGNTWEITAENFNLGETESGSGECVGALSGQDLHLPSNLWLLGDSFMKNVYTVFSVDETAVGFAALA